MDSIDLGLYGHILLGSLVVSGACFILADLKEHLL